MKLTRAILIDALIAACFYGWRAEHIDGARIFLGFWMGFVSFSQWIFVLFGEKDDLHRRSKVYIVYNMVSTMVIVGALVWCGWTVLAIILFIGWIFTCAILDGHKKETA